MRNARPLAAGERVLLYSDGITERRLKDGSRFGVEGIAAAIRTGRDGSAAGLVAAVVLFAPDPQPHTGSA